MKALLARLTVAMIVAIPIFAFAQANLENDPAYLPLDKAFDIKAIKPEVNINLPKFLLKDALADLDGGKNDPLAGTGINLSELIQDIKLIRVVVMKGTETTSESINKGITTLKSTLETKWTAVAVVGEENEKVGVYAISDPTGEAIAGLAVLVHEKGGDTIIANIVGRVSIGKLITAASRFHKFPKDLLKKLTKAGDPGSKGGDGGTGGTDGEEKRKAEGEKPAN